MLTATSGILAALSLLAPQLADAQGWGLRVERLAQGPLLVREPCEAARIRITLLNKAARPRRAPLLASALAAKKLVPHITTADGRPVRRHFEVSAKLWERDWVEVGAGRSISVELALSDFGYRWLMEPGKYRAALKLETAEGAVSSLPWTVEAVDPTAADALASHQIPLAAAEARRKPEDRPAAFVQQVKLGDRVFLVYRAFGRGAQNALIPTRVVRLAELPGKVGMAVSGEYGAGKQLTVVFDDPKEPGGKRTVVIDQ